jgi:HlyD family secretion protein
MSGEPIRPVAGGSSPRRWRRRAAALLVAGLVLAGCGAPEETATGGPSEATTAVAETRAVRVVTVAPDTLVATRSASVTLQASQESRVAAGASGRVEEVAAREGAAVGAGDALVRLDPVNAQAGVDNAELALAQARINLERARRGNADAAEQAASAVRTAERNLALVERQLTEAEGLLALGAVAQADVDALRAEASQAEGALLQAQEAVGRTGRAEGEDLALLELQVAQSDVQLRSAREALTETVVRAPFAGEVAETYVEVGEFVAAGSPVVRLLGSGPQVASFTVAPEDAALLEGRGEIAIVVGGREVAATITRLERQAERARLVTVLAQVDADAPRATPGTLGEVRYDVVLGEGLRVPSGALSADAGRTYLFRVATEDDLQVAQRVEVRVSAESGSYAVVVGVPEEALKAGDTIVHPRPLDVRDGTAVRVVGE